MFVHKSSLRRGINIDELEEKGGVVLLEEEAAVPSSHSGTTTAPSSDSGGSLSSRQNSQGIAATSFATKRLAVEPPGSSWSALPLCCSPPSA